MQRITVWATASAVALTLAIPLVSSIPVSARGSSDSGASTVASTDIRIEPIRLDCAVRATDTHAAVRCEWSQPSLTVQPVSGCTASTQPSTSIARSCSVPASCPRPCSPISRCALATSTRTASSSTTPLAVWSDAAVWNGCGSRSSPIRSNSSDWLVGSVRPLKRSAVSGVARPMPMLRWSRCGDRSTAVHESWSSGSARTARTLTVTCARRCPSGHVRRDRHRHVGHVVARSRPTTVLPRSTGGGDALIARRRPLVEPAASFEQLDDAALARRACDDPEVFAVFFRRHVRDVHRFVRRRTGDDALADDLTAVTFQRCWSALGKMRPDRTTLRPWLMRIAANEMASHYRSEADGIGESDWSMFESSRCDERTIEPSIEGDAELVAALSTLSERYQTVLALRFLADLTTEEAAEAMDMSRQHLAVLQHRALGALRRVMTPREEDDHVR